MFCIWQALLYDTAHSNFLGTVKVLKMKLQLSPLITLGLYTTTSALSIAEINGDRFLSSYRGQRVSNVTGLVTAKGPDGFWLRSLKADRNVRTSESIYVFGKAVLGNVTVGDNLSLDATVAEYRSSPDYIFLTELTGPGNITVQSSGNAVTPIVIGSRGLDPPTKQFSLLDNGDVFSLPNNASQISNANPVLEPGRYGLDFWESLSGELVTVKKARAISRPNNFGDTWVVGSWETTGKNKRGGLTMTNKGQYTFYSKLEV